MARNFKELQAKMTPESRARSVAKATRMIAEMPLDELRAARELTQEQMAGILGVNQAAISKMEHRLDMYVSTLRSFITGMGGKLEIRAVFPEGTVAINHFDQISRASKKEKVTKSKSLRQKRLS